MRWTRNWPFRAGQVVSLALVEGGPQRMYSLATGSGQGEAGILFNRVEAGELTPSMAELEPGATVWVSEPFGSFPGSAGPAVWIATGTGVAPFLSMVLSGLGAGKTLIHGARTLDSFYGQDLLAEHLGTGYVRCCTTEAAPGVFSGRLTRYLEAQPWTADRPYLLCGSAPMIVDVREILFRKGVPFRSILAEVFF
ncbi:MAG: hypothetical protein WCG80_01385 [Spirochaetales bacterium]